jgi:AraC-like DNA-binding protein
MIRSDGMADIRLDESEVLHYDIPDHSVYVRKNNIIARDTFEDISIHWHDEIEFIYVSSGSIQYQLNGSMVRMKAGEGIFVNSRQLHLIVSDHSDCELYCLIFHPTILCASNYIARHFVVPVIENDAMPYLLLSDDVSWQKTILENIATIERVSSSSAGEIKVMKYLYDIWTALYENMQINTQNEYISNQDLAYVKAMISFIQNNYKRKIELKELCMVGKVGKTKGISLFNQYLNMTPLEYVCNYRIEKSCALLKKTDLTVTEIAYETGFLDGSYFSKMFKKRMGMSPLKYRKNEGRSWGESKE